MNNQAFQLGFMKSATAAGFSEAQAFTLMSKVGRQGDMNPYAAGLTSMLGMPVDLIHGAIVNHRNRTGILHDKKTPGASSNQLPMSLLGGLLGGGIGFAGGTLTDSTDESAMLDALIGGFAGRGLGGAYGAHRYNTKLHALGKRDGTEQ